MKQVIIFGADQFAQLLTHFLRQENKYEIVAYTVEAAYINASTRYIEKWGGGRPLSPLKKWKSVIRRNAMGCSSVQAIIT